MKRLIYAVIALLATSITLTAQPVWTQLQKQDPNRLTLSISCGSATRVACEAVVNAAGTYATVYDYNFATSMWLTYSPPPSSTSWKYPDITPNGSLWFLSYNGGSSYSAHTSLVSPNNIFLSANPKAGQLTTISARSELLAIGCSSTGNNNVYETTNGGTNWSQLPGTASLSFFKVERGFDGALWGITYANNLYKHVNNTWQLVAKPINTGSITDIAVADSNRVLVVQNGVLFRKRGALDAWETVPHPISNAILRASIASDGTIYTLGITSNLAQNLIHTINYDCLGPVNSTPTANLNICAGQTTTLSAYGNTTREWFDVPTGGSPISFAPSLITPPLTSNTTYYVQLNNSILNCTPLIRTAITVNVAALANAPTIDPGSVNVCIPSGTSTVVSVQSQFAPANVRWYTDSLSTTSIGNGENYITPNLTVATTYWAAELTGTNCLSPKTKVTVNVISDPVNTTPSSNTNICANTTTILSATGPGTLSWYNLPTGGSVLGTGGSFTTPVITSNATYYAQSQVGGFCNSARTAISIVVQAGPAAPVSNTPSQNITICSGSSTNLTVQTPPPTNSSQEWWASATSTSVLGTGFEFVTPALSTTTTYWVSHINFPTGCSSVRTPITVNVVSLPNAGTLSGNQNVCVGATTTFSSTQSGGVWSSSNSTVASVNPSTGVITGVSNGQVTITYTVSATGCPTATATRSVTVNTSPTAAISPTTATICNGQSQTLTASGGTSYAWSNSGGSNAAATFSPTTNTTYTVTVTANGCSSTASRLVTVTAVPTASITPAIVTICSGESASLTASGGGTYAWSNSGGSAAAATFSPTTTTTYTVTVTANNCSATASKLVTVNALPLATLTPASPAICAGASQTLTAGGGGTYAWSAGLGAGATKSVSPTATTTYTVTVTSAANCSATASSTVTVNTTTATINGPTTICSGLSATLTASGGGTYAWSNAASTAAITVSPTTATTYTLTVTNNNCTATASQTVSVQSAPTAFISGSNSVCLGSSITLTANGGNTYAWSNGATSSSITVNPTTATTYTVTASLGQGCTATASQAVTIKQPTTGSTSQTICFGQSFLFNGISRTQSGAYLDTLVNLAGCDSFLTLNLTVRPQITGAIARTVCFGGSTSFNGATLTQSGVFKDTLTSVTGCDSILTLTFAVRPRIATTLNQPICNGSAITFNGQTITTAGTYLDTLTSVVGCDSFITLNVIIAQATAATVNQSACGSYSFGGQVLTTSGTYLDTITNLAGCDSFITLNLTIKQATASTKFDTICNGDSYSFGSQTLNQSGTFNRTITNAVGCDSVITLNLFVRPVLNVSITQAGANLSANVGFVSYAWKLNGSTVGTSQTYTATANGSYTVEVIDANGCKNTSAAVQVTGLSINDTRLSDIRFEVYPNPANEVLNIEVEAKEFTLIVTDIEGRKMMVAENQKVITLNALASGVYNIEIKTESGIARKQFIKE